MFNLKLSMREKKKKKNTTVVLFKAVVRKAASSSIRCTRTQSATTNEHALVHNQGEQTGGSEWRSLHLYIIVVKRVYLLLVPNFSYDSYVPLAKKMDPEELVDQILVSTRMHSCFRGLCRCLLLDVCLCLCWCMNLL